MPCAVLVAHAHVYMKQKVAVIIVADHAGRRSQLNGTIQNRRFSVAVSCFFILQRNRITKGCTVQTANPAEDYAVFNIFCFANLLDALQNIHTGLQAECNDSFYAACSMFDGLHHLYLPFFILYSFYLFCIQILSLEFLCVNTIPPFFSFLA